MASSSRSLSRSLFCVECTARSSSHIPIQRRAFSTTPTSLRQAVVPPFSTEASTPRLTALLSTIRNKIVLPAHLTRAHQKLVYGAKHKQMLQDDPVNVTLGDETFRLQHIDRTKDVPGTWSSFFQTISLCQDKKDWDNIPFILEGFHAAGYSMPADRQDKFIRKAGLAGRSDIVVESVRRAARTGFKLHGPEQVIDLLWHIQYEAALDNWSAKKLQKAMKAAEEVMVVLETKEHHVVDSATGVDARRRPETIAILLQIASNKAKKEAKDVENKAQTYAERLIQIIRDDATQPMILMEPSPSVSGGRSRWLARASALLNGLTTAAEVVTPARSELTKIATSLKPRVESVYQQECQREKVTLGRAAYEVLIQAKA